MHNRKVMRLTTSLFIVVLVGLISCSQARAPLGYRLSFEEMRRAHIDLVDTVTLRTDSIGAIEELALLTAESWMLIDDSTGLVISTKNANRIACMASITKIMTCLLALENSNLDDSVYIDEDSYISKDSRVKLGDGFLLSCLIDEMMLVSDNDAAYAIAKHVGGDTLRFCEMMNEKAAYLGMDNTHFANPNGIPNIDNYSSASDLVRLCRYAMRASLFYNIVSTVEKDIPLLDGRHMSCHNTNVLLSSYEGCIGIKTGFTRQAGY
jgi:D-alanyl-D-alanine carboxypeptidase